MGFRSDGRGNSRAPAAAGRTERGGARGCSPAFVVFGVPGLKTERAWVGEDLRVMRDPPVAFAGLGAALERGCDGGGGSEGRTSPARGVPASGEVYRL